MKSLKISAFALATASLAVPASAATEWSFDFQFDPAAIQTDDGARALHQALEREIESHCETPGARRLLVAQRIEQACIDRALDRAVTQIDTPPLKRIHKEWTASKR